MDTTPLISVIVPVYNVETYLYTCVQSIIKQTFSNLEILLVDDGSTDSSGILCDKLEATDNRITTLHQANQGLSQARNSGIKVAHGKYLAFVDSDDCIAPDFIETLYGNLIATNANISICSIEKVSEDQEPLANNTRLPNEILDSKTALTRMLSDPFTGWQYVPAWNKLYESSLFKDIQFPAGKYHEDEFIIFQIFDKAKKIVSDPKALYFYTQRKTGIMHASNALQKLDALEARYLQYTFCLHHGYEDCIPYVQDLARRSYYLVLFAQKQAKTKLDKAKIKKIKAMIKSMNALPSWQNLLKDLIYYSFFNK